MYNQPTAKCLVYTCPVTMVSSPGLLCVVPSREAACSRSSSMEQEEEKEEEEDQFVWMHWWGSQRET